MVFFITQSKFIPCSQDTINSKQGWHIYTLQKCASEIPPAIISVLAIKMHKKKKKLFYLSLEIPRGNVFELQNCVKNNFTNYWHNNGPHFMHVIPVNGRTFSLEGQ